MKTLALAVAVMASSAAYAQVRVEVGVPSIRFEAPPPVYEVEPGVQVVGDSDDEVFLVDGAYWHRRGGHWYRAGDHTGHWVVVEDRVVPRHIYGYAPGRYRRWHPAAAVRRDERHEVRKEERREEKHEEKREEKREEHRR